MASNKTAFVVGMFVITGLILAISIIIWLGMSKYFDNGKNYVAYFDESVQGLAKDSAVKYRGVAIGRVVTIDVADDGRLIEVVLSLDTKLNPESNMTAQLKSVGITGIMFIELDQKGENEPDRSPKISFEPKYPVIATKPSGIKLFFEGVDIVLEQIKAFNGKEIASKLTSIMDSVNRAIEDAQIGILSSDLHFSLSRLEKILEPEKWDHTIRSLETAAKSVAVLSETAQKTVSNLDRHLSTLSVNANQTVVGLDAILMTTGKSLNEAAGEFRNTLRVLNKFLESGTTAVNTSEIKLAGLQRHLTVTLQNLEKASDNLNKLIELLSEQPSQLIFGEPIPVKEADLMEK